MSNSIGLLSGLRVIDFGQYIAAPLVAMILADQGATVIHVDPPGGPRFDDPANAVLMRGKQNIILNLKADDDLAIAKKLIASADIVIEGFRPCVMERLGLGAEQCTANNSRLIYCSIPGFSKNDSRAQVAAWEGIISAEAGLYQISRFEAEKGTPTFNALPQASIFGAAIAAHSIIAALIARERSGKGQIIEAPLYDACFESCGIFGQAPKGKPSASNDIRSSFRGLMGYKCKDGRYLQLSPPKRGVASVWDYMVDPSITDPDQISKILSKKFTERTMLEWEKLVQEQLHAGGASILSSKEWLHDEHALSSRSVIEIDDPVYGKTYQPGPAVHVPEKYAAQIHPRTLPDSDRELILKQLDEYMRNENQPVSKSSHNAAKTALEGFKVLDLCQVLAGPIGARILSEYGAKVIKINNPRQFENPTGMAGHETVNCGKLTSFIDLKSDEGRSLMRELISEADVFHCNFAQETFTRLGIDENSIREINPNIVFSQVNVHSIGGWRENYRGHEELGEAVSGMEERYGNSYSGATLPITICDNSTGCMSALGMLLALYHRERTGEGIYVQASLSRSAGYLQIPYMIDFSGKLWNEPRGKKVKGWSAINRLYKTADGWIFICAEKDPSAICSVSGLEDIDITSDNLADILEERFALESAGIWVNRLSAVNIAARQSRDFCDDAMTEAYAIERGLSVCREHRGIGKIRVIGCAPRLSDTPAKPAFAVAAKGEDTKTVETFRWQWEIPNN